MYNATKIAAPSEQSKLNFARSIAKVHLSSKHRHFHEKRISKDIVLYFLRANKMAMFSAYLHLMHDKSSKLHRSSFKDSANEMGMGEANFYKLMKQLEMDGFVDRKGGGWWFGRGTKQFNIAVVDNPSGETSSRPARDLRSSDATRTMKTSSRFVATIARNLTRSSRGWSVPVA